MILADHGKSSIVAKDKTHVDHQVDAMSKWYLKRSFEHKLNMSSVDVN